MALLSTLVALIALLMIFPKKASASTNVTIACVFGDHMVLQRNKPIRLWGRAAPGEAISIQLGEKCTQVNADDGGQWRVELEALPSGGPHTLLVQGTTGSVSLKDILIGEVWICSGQSNMEWPLFASNDGALEAASAKYSRLRLCTVQKTTAHEPQEGCTARWSPCTPEAAWSFSAVAYFFGRMLHNELEVPVGLIHSSWGGTPAQSWTSRSALETEPVFVKELAGWDKLVDDYPEAKRAYEKQMAAWEKSLEAHRPELTKPLDIFTPEDAWRPASLYNAMIAPLTPLTIAGAIWYQGESNADKAYDYATLFPLMIQDWRRAFEQGDFPFLFVQLANHMPQYDAPQPYSQWAELREAQLKTLELPKTAMAVAIDLGDADDIHPRNKQDVGKRLALAALAENYDKAIAFSGPTLGKTEMKGAEIHLHFENTDGGLVAKDGDALTGFAVAGADKHFVWADAQIKGSTVIVRSGEVTEPLAVRYAWADNPSCNLYNAAGLPASPFRTDEWGGVTSPSPSAFETLPSDATVFGLGLMPFGWTRNMHGPYGFLGDNYCMFPGDGECTFRWDLTGLTSGRYHLFTWVPADPSGGFVTRTPFTIHHDEGETGVELRQCGGERGWHELGQFAFSPGAYVEVSNRTDTFVFADALMVTPVR
jgi:sialate O-acetylesterase